MNFNNTISVNKENKTIEININQPIRIIIPDSKNNRKMLAPLLQSNFNLIEKYLFTHQYISEKLYRKESNRQNSSFHVEQFRNIYNSDYRLFLSNKKESDNQINKIVNDFFVNPCNLFVVLII